MAVRKKLGEILVEQGATTPDKVKRGLGYQRQWGGKVGRILVEMKLVSEEQLARALASQSRMPLAKMKAEIPASVVALVPQELAEKHEAIAFGMRTVDKAETVYVALADPYNITGMDEIRFRIGKTVKFALAPADEIKRAQARARGEVVREAELPVEEPRRPAELVPAAPLPVSGDPLAGLMPSAPPASDPLADLFSPPQPAASPVSELDELLGLGAPPPPPSAASVLDDLFSPQVAAPPQPVSPPVGGRSAVPVLPSTAPVGRFGPASPAAPSPPVITAATSPQGVSSAGAGLDSLVGAPVDQGFILDHSSPAEALATLASQEQPAGDLGFVLDHSSPAEALSSLVDSPDGFGAVETPGEEPLQLELGADAAAAMTLGLAIDESVVVAANAPELELTEADAVPSFELTAEDMAPDSPEQAPAESDALRFGSVDPPSLGVESLFGTGPAIGEAGAVQRFSAVRIEPLGGEDVELDVSSIEQGFAGVSEELAPPRGAAAAEDAPPFGAADDRPDGVAADAVLAGSALDGAKVEEPAGGQPDSGAGYDLAATGVAGEDLDVGLSAESLFGEEFAAQPFSPVPDDPGAADVASWAESTNGPAESDAAATAVTVVPEAEVDGAKGFVLGFDEATAEAAAHDDDGLDISLNDAESPDPVSAEAALDGAGFDEGLEVTLTADEEQREDLPFEVDAGDEPNETEATPEPLEEALDISIAEEESAPQSVVVGGEGELERESAAAMAEAVGFADEALGASLDGAESNSTDSALDIMTREDPLEADAQAPVSATRQAYGDDALAEGLPGLLSLSEGAEPASTADGLLPGAGLDISVSEEPAPEVAEVEAELAGEGFAPSVLVEPSFEAAEAAARLAGEGLALSVSGEQVPEALEADASLADPTLGLSVLEEPTPGLAATESDLAANAPGPSVPEAPEPAAEGFEAGLFGEGLDLSAPEQPTLEAARPEPVLTAGGLGFSERGETSAEALDVGSDPMGEEPALEVSEAPSPEAAAIESHLADGLDLTLSEPMSDPLSDAMPDAMSDPLFDAMPDAMSDPLFDPVPDAISEVVDFEAEQRAEGAGVTLSQDLVQETAAIEPDLTAEGLELPLSETLVPESTALDSNPAADEIGLSVSEEPSAEVAELELLALSEGMSIEDAAAGSSEMADGQGLSPFDAPLSEAAAPEPAAGDESVGLALSEASSLNEEAPTAESAAEGFDLGLSEGALQEDPVAAAAMTVQDLELSATEGLLADAGDAVVVPSVDESAALSPDAATDALEASGALEGLSFEKVESGELGKAESELPGGSADVSLLEDSPTAEAFDPEADAAGRGFEDSPIAEVADEFSPAGETPEQEVASEPGCAALPVEGVDLEQLDAGVEVESQQAPGALEAGEAERDSTFSSFETGEPSAEPGDESGSMSSGIAVPPDADALGQESIPTPAGFGADEPSAARSAELALDGEQPLAGLLPEESAEGEAGGASLVPPEPAELEGWDSMPSASDAEEGESGPAIEDPSGSEAVPTAEDFANLENRASEPDRPVGLEDEAAGCELSPVSDSGNEVDPWSAGGATDALSQQTETDSSPADLAGAAVAVVDLDATTLDSQAAAAASFELAAEPSEPDETAPSAAGESSFETNAQEFAPACDPSDPSVQDALGPLDWGASPSDLGAEGASTSFEDSPVNDALPVEPSSAPQAALDDEIEIPLADGVSEPAASGSAAPPPEVAPAAPAVPSDFELAVLAGLRCIAEGRVGEGRPIPVDRLGRVAVKLLLEKGAITSDDLIEMLAVSPETLSTLIVKLLLNQKLIGPEDLVSMLAIPPDRLNATVLLLLIEKGVFDCSSVVKALG